MFLDLENLGNDEVDAICWKFNFVQGVLLLHEAGYPANNIPLCFFIEEAYEFYEAYISCVCENLFKSSYSIYQAGGDEISLKALDYELSEDETAVFRDYSYNVLEIVSPEIQNIVALEGADSPRLAPVRKALKDFRTEADSLYWSEIHVIMSSRVNKTGDIIIIGELTQINPPDLVRWLIEIKRSVERVVGHA